MQAGFFERRDDIRGMANQMQVQCILKIRLSSMEHGRVQGVHGRFVDQPRVTQPLLKPGIKFLDGHA